MYDYHIELIEKAKKKLGLKSDYALSKKLDIPQQTFSNWKNGRSNMDASAAAIFSEVLDIPYAEIMIKIERRKSYLKRWKKALELSRSAAACAILSCGIYAGSAVTMAATAQASDLTTYTLCAILLLLYFSMVSDFTFNRSQIWSQFRHRVNSE